MGKIVTVFGSSIPKPGEEEYETAYSLGKILGGSGISVCTGGYNGIMDAVSKGVTELGQEAIGITVDIFNASPSKYLTRNISTNSLQERLTILIETGDAFIILPGGTGTMLELSLVWEHLNKRLMKQKPVACFGEMWKPIVSAMEKRIKLEKRRTDLIKCSDDIVICADYIITSLRS